MSDYSDIYKYSGADSDSLKSQVQNIQNDSTLMDKLSSILSDLNSAMTQSDVSNNITESLNKITNGSGINGSISKLNKDLNKIANAADKLPAYHRALERYENYNGDDERKERRLKRNVKSNILYR